MLICLMMLLGACKQPVKYTPTSPSQNHSYTAAVATIAAQLTDIANSTRFVAGTPSTDKTKSISGMQTLAIYSSTETLPETSTPLPTKTPIPSDTLLPSPTLTAILTPTQNSNSPTTSLGNPTWTDNFNDATNWPLYNDQYINMQIDNGKLSMIALIPNTENPWDGWMVSLPYVADFYLTVIANPGECSGLDRYGLLARAAPDASHAYLFGFSCDRQYSLRIWNGIIFLMLIEWTPSQFINQGAHQTNRLGLKAEGNRLSLFANNNLLGEVENDIYSEGAFGLFVGAAHTANFTVLFDEMAYWELP